MLVHTDSIDIHPVSCASISAEIEKRYITSTLELLPPQLQTSTIPFYGEFLNALPFCNESADLAYHVCCCFTWEFFFLFLFFQRFTHPEACVSFVYFYFVGHIHNLELLEGITYRKVSSSVLGFIRIVEFGTEGCGAALVLASLHSWPKILWLDATNCTVNRLTA